MADRFDKFTERARKVLQLAQEEAQRFNHNYIGTEHLLLGLVREGDGVAAKVLANLGVELNKVRSAVEFIIGRGDRTVAGDIGLTPRAKKVIELASTKRGGSIITTSAPSTCCLVWSARAKASRPACSSGSASAWTRCARRSSTS